VNLSDYLKNLGKPVCYYPQLCSITGGTSACIFLCAVAWKAFEDRDGWLEATMDELSMYTGMSEDEQRTARKNLKKLNLLEERHLRLHHKMFYRVNFEKLDALFAAKFTRFPETGNGNLGRLTSPVSKPYKISTCTNTSEGEDFPSNGHEPAQPQPSLNQLRLGRLFKRRDSTRWSAKELKALKALGEIPEHEMSIIEAYYTHAHSPDSDYRRRDLQTLLNNWSGELDRARNFKPRKEYNL
jgi:hypothetical protein